MDADVPVFPGGHGGDASLAVSGRVGDLAAPRDAKECGIFTARARVCERDFV